MFQQMYFLLLRRYREQGIELVQASDGRDAIAKIRDNPEISLIILDVLMPEMDGLTFLRLTRQVPDISRIPVIAVSIDGKEETRSGVLQAGARSFLTKPLRATDLYPRIEEIHPDWSASPFAHGHGTSH
jgi:CheY-like chemotaxis protein